MNNIKLITIEIFFPNLQHFFYIYTPIEEVSNIQNVKSIVLFR